MIWLLIILFALGVYLIFFVTQFINIIFKGYPPFISTNRNVIRGIIKELSIAPSATVYELGCGRARFLRLVEKSFPATKLIGLENLFSLYLLIKISLKVRGSHIKLRPVDFFSINLAEADLIYCYLNDTLMIRLGEKFRRECRPGTQIVSQSFTIPQLSLEKMLEIKGKRIYFYKI